VHSPTGESEQKEDEDRPGILEQSHSKSGLRRSELDRHMILSEEFDNGLPE
jgi:hypothetical protein